MIFFSSKMYFCKLYGNFTKACGQSFSNIFCQVSASQDLGDLAPKLDTMDIDAMDSFDTRDADSEDEMEERKKKRQVVVMLS